MALEPENIYFSCFIQQFLVMRWMYFLLTGEGSVFSLTLVVSLE